jgi:VanZ family protein
MAARHRSTAALLTWLYAALIVYASLSPFSGWAAPLEVPYWGLGHMPWPKGWGQFDVAANFVGYMPLGSLLLGALVRSSWRVRWAVVLAALGGMALSFSLESLQNYLPQRVPSSLDWALNTGGTLAGVLLAWLMQRLGLVDRWQLLRDRWFIERSAGGMTLWLLWPVGLLFPTPVPLGVGQVLMRLQELTKTVLQDTPWAAWAESWFDAHAAVAPLSQGSELLTTLLGLLAPCCVAFTITTPGWRRVFLIALSAAFGFMATTLSTTLNFGPEHALAWLTAPVLPALGAAILLALMLCDMAPRGAAALGLVLITALVLMVMQAPADPYYAQSLFAWEQGRFIRFHGAAQWVGWLWPYAALCYFFSRVLTDDALIGTAKNN